MCKDFVLMTSNSMKRYECIGDFFIEKEKETEHVLSVEQASIIHNKALNKASYVRMRKHVHEIIM